MSSQREYRKIFQVGGSHFFSIPATMKKRAMKGRKFKITLLTSPLTIHYDEVKQEDAIKQQDTKNIVSLMPFGPTPQFTLRVPAHIYKFLVPFHVAHFKIEFIRTEEEDRMFFTFKYISDIDMQNELKEAKDDN
jgi:hypothetical protein